MRDIVGYEGSYAVTEDGRVWSYCSKKWLKVKIAPRGKGYLYASLWQDNKETKFYCHRLVAQAYIPNPFGKKTVNHIDGNTMNNNRANLEWMTTQEQSTHAWATGLTNNSGENCGTAKLSEEQVQEIKDLYGEGDITQREIAERFHINQSQVSRILNKKRWRLTSAHT